jgi:hypothetical protein
MLRLPMAIDGRNHPEHLRQKEKILINVRSEMQFVCEKLLASSVFFASIEIRHLWR